MVRSYSGYNFTVHCSKVCIDSNLRYVLIPRYVLKHIRLGYCITETQNTIMRAYIFIALRALHFRPILCSNKL